MDGGLQFDKVALSLSGSRTGLYKIVKTRPDQHNMGIMDDAEMA